MVLRVVNPCLKVVDIDRVSIFGIPRPPSLFPQYIRPLGVLAGRWRRSFTCLLMTESKERMVVTGGGNEDGCVKEVRDHVGREEVDFFGGEGLYPGKPCHSSHLSFVRPSRSGLILAGWDHLTKHYQNDRR